jgi:hypothetical protein
VCTCKINDIQEEEEEEEEGGELFAGTIETRKGVMDAYQCVHASESCLALV